MLYPHVCVSVCPSVRPPLITLSLKRSRLGSQRRSPVTSTSSLFPESHNGVSLFRQSCRECPRGARVSAFRSDQVLSRDSMARCIDVLYWSVWTYHHAINLAPEHTSSVDSSLNVVHVKCKECIEKQWFRSCVHWSVICRKNERDSRWRHFISVWHQQPRSTQPSTLRGTVKWVPTKLYLTGDHALMWVNHPLYVNQPGQLSLLSFSGR